MKLQSKITALVFSLVAILASILLLLIQNKLSHEYSQIEINQARDNTNRVADAITNLGENLASKQGDWASWDDTYEFITDLNKDYIESNLQDESVATLGVDFMLYVNTEGKLVYSKTIDPETLAGLETPTIFSDLIKPEYQLLDFKELTDHHQGIINLAGMPYVIASQQILSSSRTGPARGALIWGYQLSKKYLEKLKSITHNNFEFGLLTSLANNKQQELRANSFNTHTHGNNIFDAMMTYPDYQNKPLFYVELHLERALHAQYLSTIKTVGVGLLGISFLFGILLLMVIRHIVTAPLIKMGKELKEIAKRSDSSLRVPVLSNDEIGQMGQDINNTLESLDLAKGKIQDIQEQLFQSQKMESIGKLAGGISHDFNNILGGILGYASMLKEQYAHDPKTSKRVAVIIKSAEKGAQLTKELLAFARKGAYQKAIINLNEAMRESLTMLETTLGRGVIITESLEPQLKNIEADPTQISQVIMNLCINARDAMNGEGTIHITTKNIKIDQTCHKLAKLSPGEYVELTFQDSGTGIPETIRHKIFDPFFTTKAPGKGTGLGLSMIHGIVEANGGNITLEPYKVGEGATFKLYFVASNKELELKEENSNILTEDSLDNLKNKNILVVDDEPHLREFAKDILIEAGAYVMEAGDGAEAVDIIKTSPLKVDAVILDVIMPKMTGIEAFYAMKNLSTTAPVIFSTGFANNADLIKIRSENEVSFIQKPFKKNDLLLLVTEALDKTHG